MKALFFIFSILISGIALSQDTITISSSELDSLIWKRINTYRKQKGSPELTIFENSKMREFSKKVTLSNSRLMLGKHSYDSIGYSFNGECLWQLVGSGDSKSFIERINNLLNGDYTYCVDKAVNSWINSPTHEKILSRPEYTISTVTAIITIIKNKNGEFSLRIDASYHTFSNRPGACYSEEANEYVAQLIKKQKKKGKG